MDNANGIQVVVGLGNPGADYVMTRHNAGFWFVDALAQRYGGRFSDERKFHGDVARVSVEGHDLRLLKPQTYMNRSGLSVQSLAAYLKVPPACILVVHDDIDLPAGVARLKRGGGHGGHNGLRDISRVLGQDYPRLRLGVGRPQHASEVIDYVLKRSSREDEERIVGAVADALDVLPVLLADGFDKAMHQLHSRNASELDTL